MKIRKTHRAGDTISTHEMRFKFDRVLRAVKAGQSLTLTYRNQPLARIVPFQAEAEPAANDPIFRLHELAEPIGPLTNAEIDATIYGT
jgi:prevent-host-death family protein